MYNPENYEDNSNFKVIPDNRDAEENKDEFQVVEKKLTKKQRQAQKKK